MTNRESVRSYLLTLPEASEDFPFGPEPAVYRVRNRMFALLTRHDGRELLNLKCDPEDALFLRDFFDAVIPGYHMNKRHWNSVILGGDVPEVELRRMIDHSWHQVVAGLPRRNRPCWQPPA